MSGKLLGFVFDAWTEAHTHYIAVIAAVQRDSDSSVAVLHAF